MRRTRFGSHKARLVALALGFAFLGSTARATHAWPTDEEARTPTSQAGLPISQMVNKPVAVLAKDLLVRKALDTESADKNKPAHRGAQFEIFAPGDFGVTFRYRW